MSWYNCTLQWCHNERDGVSNHRSFDCLVNRLFSRRSKKTLKLHVTGFCEGNPLVTGGFPSQRTSNAENASIWWRHHDHGESYENWESLQQKNQHGGTCSWIYSLARTDSQFRRGLANFLSAQSTNLYSADMAEPKQNYHMNHDRTAANRVTASGGIKTELVKLKLNSIGFFSLRDSVISL